MFLVCDQPCQQLNNIIHWQLNRKISVLDQEVGKIRRLGTHKV